LDDKIDAAIILFLVEQLLGRDGGVLINLLDEQSE
jgi:hypothetical protein